MTNNRWVRNSLIYLLIIIGVIVIFYTLIPSFGSSEQMSLKQVLDQSRGGQIKQIIVDGEKLTVIPQTGAGGEMVKYTSRIGKNTDLIQLLADHGALGRAFVAGRGYKGSSGSAAYLASC